VGRGGGGEKMEKIIAKKDTIDFTRQKWTQTWHSWNAILYVLTMTKIRTSSNKFHAKLWFYFIKPSPNPHGMPIIKPFEKH
jgi:hypothetical protein